MLVDLFVNALLSDEILADQVWELWDARMISDETAELAGTQQARFRHAAIGTNLLRSTATSHKPATGRRLLV